MKEQREEFVQLARQPQANISELCRRFGISRKTGYKWLGREDLEDRSRRPQTSPRRTLAEQESQVEHRWELLALREERRQEVEGRGVLAP